MQEKKTKSEKIKGSHRWPRVLFGILIFLIIVITGIIWYWNTHKKAIIKNKLEAAVRNKSDSLYKVKYDSLAMNEMTGYLSLYDVNLSYDSARYAELISRQKEPAILLNIFIPQISVYGVKTPKALIGNEIVGRKLEIKNPVIHLLYTGTDEDSSGSIFSSRLYKQLLGNLDLIQADTILITGAQITSNSKGVKTTSVQMQNVSLTLVNVKVDSVSEADTTRMFFAKEVNADCDKITWSGADKFYKYSMDGLSINSLNHSLRIKNFRVIPVMDEDVFVRALPIHDDRFDFSASTIRAENINPQELLKENFIADSVFIGEADFKIYTDLAVPSSHGGGRTLSYPHQLLETIGSPCRIGKIILSKGFVEYKERNDITRLYGKVQFYTIRADISNFTNDKKAIAANNILSVDITSQFMNKAPMKVASTFDLAAPEGRLDLKGSLGALDLRSLNVLTEPMSLISLKSGRLHNAEFNLHGHDFGMDGTMEILYDDLKITMLRKVKGSYQPGKKILLSLFTNMVVKNSNPDKNKNARVVPVHSDPDVRRSFFNITWKTLRDGIKKTAEIKSVQ